VVGHEVQLTGLLEHVRQSESQGATNEAFTR
jgi:hypothetical protein